MLYEEGMLRQIFVGLDLSLTGTGIVIIDGVTGRSVLSEKVGYSLTMDASEKEKIERMIKIVTEIVVAVKRYVSDFSKVHIGIENYAFGTVRSRKGRAVQSSSQTGLAELHGVVKTQMHLSLHLEPSIIPVTSARKEVLGKGRFKGGKKEIIAAVCSYGFETSNDNLADAFVIAECLRLRTVKVER